MNRRLSFDQLQQSSTPNLVRLARWLSRSMQGAEGGGTKAQIAAYVRLDWAARHATSERDIAEGEKRHRLIGAIMFAEKRI